MLEADQCLVEQGKVNRAATRGSPIVDNSRKGIPSLVVSNNNNGSSVTRNMGRRDVGPDHAEPYTPWERCQLLL